MFHIGWFVLNDGYYSEAVTAGQAREGTNGLRVLFNLAIGRGLLESGRHFRLFLLFVINVHPTLACTCVAMYPGR